MLSRRYNISDENTLQGSPSQFLESARQRNVEIQNVTISSDDFEDFRKLVDYNKNYPDYRTTYPTDELIKKKGLEHFLSLKLIDQANNRCILDAGGCTSPFGKIATTFYGFANYYHLDLPRRALGIKEGIHGNIIGADAAFIPLPNESVTCIVSHNAIEHFEGKSYSGFLSEGMRILEPGGEMIILPLFYSRETFSYTSLHRWYQDKRIPNFIDKNIILREDIRQPYSRHVSIKTLTGEFFDKYSSQAIFRIIYFENYRSINHGFPFALYAQKKRSKKLLRGRNKLLFPLRRIMLRIRLNLHNVFKHRSPASG